MRWLSNSYGSVHFFSTAPSFHFHNALIHERGVSLRAARWLVKHSLLGPASFNKLLSISQPIPIQSKKCMVRELYEAKAILFDFFGGRNGSLCDGQSIGVRLSYP